MSCCDRHVVILLASLIIFLVPSIAISAHRDTPNWSEIVGQNFIVGIPGPDLDTQTEIRLRAIKPAGVILYFRNCRSRTQIKGLIARLQEIARDSTGHDYFIMLDEEPGGATRLGLFHHVFRTGLPDWGIIRQDIGTLADLGINVELAPLADYPFNRDTFMARRLPPVRQMEDLMEFNQSFMRILHEHNISATLKHFPGMGVFVQDPHYKLPRLCVDEATFQKSLRLFHDGISSGADFIMTAHGLYDNIDSENTVVTSRKIVTGLLREALGFQGIIVTDDFADMKYSLSRKANIVDVISASLKAGHNLVMFSHRLEKTKKIFDKFLKRVADDPELQTVVKNNYDQIIRFKESRLKERAIRQANLHKSNNQQEGLGISSPPL